MPLYLVFILLGIIVTLLAVIFKEQISRFYDNVDGLDERQKFLYKKYIIKIPGIIFIPNL